MIGRVLRQRYELVRILGEGGMGVVYEARDRSSGGRVAVKVLEVAAGSRAKHIAPRFQREAAAAMAIDSPHVTRVFEHGAEGEVLFLVMELLDGEDLQQVLTRRRVLSPISALLIAAQACEGLGQAHQRGIIHRDVKPANLFLTRGPSGDIVVKILDFGIAKLRLEEAGAGEGVDLTRTGTLLGSPQYMSPEQARGSRRIDHRSDVWSLGVVLYRALSGHVPHEGVDGIGELIMAICNDPPRPLALIAPAVPPDVADIVSRALRLDPEHRYPTIAAMLEAIRRAVPEGARLDPDELFAPGVSVRTGAGPASADLPTVSTDERVVVMSQRSMETPGIGMTTTIAALDEEQSTTIRERRSSEPSRAEPPPPAPSLSPSPRRVTAFRVGIAAATVALMTGGVFALSRRDGSTGPRPIESAAPSASAVAPPAPSSRSIVDLPEPARCAAPASAAYREGLRALRGGRWDDAHVAFERAAKEDPTCAEAWLRLVITGLGRYPVTRLRQAYSSAVELRDALRERDRLYLDAFEPVVRREPPDPKELALRLRKLAEAHPEDAELIYMASYYAGYEAAELSFKIDAAKRALALDPQYSDAWQQLGEALDKAGRRDEALSALEECIRVAPSSSDCAQEHIGVLSRAGRCPEAVSDVKRWLALAPNNPSAYRNLAAKLLAAGGADAMIEEALAQSWGRLRPEDRARKEPYDRALLAVLRGDLRGAEGLARDTLKAVESNADLNHRLSPTLLLIETLLETNERRAAGALARDFLDRTAVLSVTLTRDVLTMSQFFLEPLLLDAIRRSGEVKDLDYRAKRDEWHAAAERAAMLSAETRWALSFALLAATPEEAREALEHAPPSLMMSGGDMRSQFAPLGGAYVGRALLLADRPADALKFLRSAASSCDPLRDPFTHTRVHFWLGQALGKQGDREGACAAFNVVLKRWGKASPPSVTATAARSAASALRCAP